MIFILTGDNDQSKEAMLEVLKEIQGFPMLDGADWNETNWEWRKSLLNLRIFISHKDDIIFKAKTKTSEILNPDTVKKNLHFKIWMI